MSAAAGRSPWHSERMESPVLSELRLTAFKSHLEQRVALKPLTLLVGPNASGKSNVIDALTVLALLADERGLTDLERGDQAVAGLRGRLAEAAPFGSTEIQLGCTVTTGTGALLLDVRLDVERAEVVSERLLLRRTNRPERVLIDSSRRRPGEGFADVETYSGSNRKQYQMRSDRLVIVQAATRVAPDSEARRSVVASAAAVVEALQGVFVLDPVPGRMRAYAPIGASPDRWGAHTSALIYDLVKDPATAGRLLDLVQGLVGENAYEITFAEATVESRPVDVMVALLERAPEGEFLATARVMSDGTLRYLAIVSALLRLSSSELASTDSGRPTFVIEEIENGLFPTQASRILDLLRTEATESRTTLLATTHSPALLDALRPEDHDGVVICHRARDGHTVLTPLTEHENYVALAGGGKVGSAVAEGSLEHRGGVVDFGSLFAS